MQTVCLFSLFASVTQAFVFRPSGQPLYSVAARSHAAKHPASLSAVSMSAAVSGQHGTESHFLPIDQLDGDQTAPRILPIAGVFPGITAAEVRAPKTSPPPELGGWQYEFADPDGPQMGTAALAPSDVVNLCENPVLLISDHASLALPWRGSADDSEVLVLVDRDDVEHDERKFYLFETSPGGELVIQWTPTLPAGWAIVGRVVQVTLPFVASAGMQKQGGWLELDDDIF